MKIKIAIGFLVLLFTAISAFGDIPVMTPTPKSTPETPTVKNNLRIAFSKDADAPAKLQIPRSVLNELAKQNGGSNKTTAAFIDPKFPTIVGGAMMFFAFLLGGIWLARRKIPAKIAVAGFLMLIIGAGGTLVFANMLPPSIRSLTSRIFSSEVNAYGFARGALEIEVVEDAGTLVLTVPRVPDAKKNN